MLDIGCARGHCVRRLAHRHPEWNFLGLEIRHALVDAAVAETKAEEATGTVAAASASADGGKERQQVGGGADGGGNDDDSVGADDGDTVVVGPHAAPPSTSIKNLHHLAVNAMDPAAFTQLLNSLQAAKVKARKAKAKAAARKRKQSNRRQAMQDSQGSQEGGEAGGVVFSVAVQFPDPWARQRHRRRRLAGPLLVEVLASHPAIAVGCWTYVSSDVPDCVAQAAKELTEQGFQWHRGREEAGGGGGKSGATPMETTAEEVAALAPPPCWPHYVASSPPSSSALSSVAGSLRLSSPSPAFLGLGEALPWGPSVDAQGLLLVNPLGVDAPSEREAVCEQLWRRVYRVLFLKLPPN